MTEAEVLLAPDPGGPREPSAGGAGRRRTWIVAAIIVALLLGGAVWGVLSWGVPPAQSAQSANADVVVGKPVLVNENQLRAFAEQHGPVYWAGPESDVEYELTYTSADAVLIRYLPDGAEAGTETKYPAVATYPIYRGYENLQDAANAEGVGSQITSTDALVVVDPDVPLSTYFSFPKSNFQVEVFSPDDGKSLQMVLDGSVQLLSGQE